jgi:hypothetical protein
MASASPARGRRQTLAGPTKGRRSGLVSATLVTRLRIHSPLSAAARGLCTRGGDSAPQRPKLAESPAQETDAFTSRRRHAVGAGPSALIFVVAFCHVAMYFQYIRFMKSPSGHNVLSSFPGARTATGRTETKRLVLLLLPALGVSEKIRNFSSRLTQKQRTQLRYEEV